MAKKASYLKRRREGWYFQIAVPRALQAELGRPTIIRSLKTRDKKVARQRVWAMLVEVKEAFARLTDPAPVAKPVLPETLAAIDDFARSIYRATLAQMDADARRGVRAWNTSEIGAAYTETSVSYIHKRDYTSIAEPLSAYCAEHGIAPGDHVYIQLGDALLAARARALEGRQRALNNMPSAEPETFLDFQPIDPVTLTPLRAAGSRKGGILFAEVAERCLAEKQRDVAVRLTKQTEEQYKVAHRLFDQFARKPSLEDIDRRKASEFLDAIATLNSNWGRGAGAKDLTYHEVIARFGGHKPGLANRTLNKYVTALGIVWDYASKRDGFNGANPWQGQLRPTTARRGNSETGKRGFTTLELKRLLATKPEAVQSKKVAATLPWLAWVGAYSGMRLNEITGLDVEDIKQVGDIWYFDITKAKSEAGVRYVPVHSAILALGFLDYVSKVKSGPLWPALKPGGLDGKRGVYASKRFTVWRRKLKLIDIDAVSGRDRLDLHSLRRSAVTALKRAGVSEADIAELVGHEHAHVTLGTYADRHQLTRLQAIVEAIRYED